MLQHVLQLERLLLHETPITFAASEAPCLELVLPASVREFRVDVADSELLSRCDGLPRDDGYAGEGCASVGMSDRAVGLTRVVEVGVQSVQTAVSFEV